MPPWGCLNPPTQRKVNPEEKARTPRKQSHRHRLSRLVELAPSAEAPQLAVARGQDHTTGSGWGGEQVLLLLFR